MSEINEEYYRMHFPEEYRQFCENVSAVFNQIGKPEEITSQFKKAIQEAYLEPLRRIPKDIYDDLYMTPETLLIAVQRYKSFRRQGRSLPQSPKAVEARRCALEKIREADLQGMGWDETIRFVIDAQSDQGVRESSRRTLDQYLRELLQYKRISIQPPAPRGRGRPKKN